VYWLSFYVLGLYLPKGRADCRRVGGGVPRTPKVLIKTKRQSFLFLLFHSLHILHRSPSSLLYFISLFLYFFLLLSASTLHRNLEIKVESWKEELELMSRETEGW